MNASYEVDQERQAEERVFGYIEENPDAYPERTSLQKKMKASLLVGKSFGMGRGIRAIQQEGAGRNPNQLCIR